MTAPEPDPAATGEPFLIHFAHIHETFRQPEIDSLAALHQIPLVWNSYSDSSPHAIVTLSSAASAQTLISRSILAKGIYSLWGHASTYDALHASLRARLPGLTQGSLGKSFKFNVESFLHRRSMRSQRELIETFSYLCLDGPVSMSAPEQTFCVFEEFSGKGPDSVLRHVYFGKLVGGTSRDVVDVYDLKKRTYIGTTSMDAELSLVTANMTLAAPGKVVFDPFVGTGSFVVACSHFGAHSLGSDIDGRQIRGRKRGKSVKGNFVQYGLQGRYLDGFTSDLTNTPIRQTNFLDAIVCDPPYGVREGLKVLGSRNASTPKEPVIMNGVLRHTEPDYIPPKRPYSFEAMLADILAFAVSHLVPGGRLCFWMPCANDDDLLEIPTHPQLKLESNCVQTFNKWSRRLLTYSRRHGDEGKEEAEELRRARLARETDGGMAEAKATADELNAFRKKYFEGFRGAAAADGEGANVDAGRALEGLDAAHGIK